MDHVKSLKCLICGKEYAPSEIDYVCPDHGYEGIVDVQYDYGLISLSFSPRTLAENDDYSIWRYRPLLPMEPDSPAPPLAVGWTPLYPAPRLAESLGLRHLWIKDDGRQATASFKDRASAVAVVKAQRKGRGHHHDRQHRQRRGRAERHLRQRAAAQRHLRARKRAAGQDRPTADLWLDGDAGARHLRRRLRPLLAGCRAPTAGTTATPASTRI